MTRKNLRKTVLARIEPMIVTVNGQRVIVDNDLAKIYGVTTKRLNQQVRRNLSRFPEDFCFQLTRTGWKKIQSLRLQNATLDRGRGEHTKYLPFVFTEHGAIMAANVLRTERAVQMSVFVVRAFVRLRETALAHRDLADRLTDLERKVGRHDENIQGIIAAIRQLMATPEKPRRQIGFRVEEPKALYYTRKKR